MADLTMDTPKINTRCPACGHSTLTIDDSGNLVCSLVGCHNPTLINKLGEQGNQISHSLRGTAEEIRRLRQQVLNEQADSWNMLRQIIALFASRGGTMQECPASRADKIADMLDGRGQPF